MQSTTYNYTPETSEQFEKLTPKTVSAHAHAIGLRQGEPLIVMMDCLLKYAQAYAVRFEDKLSSDYVLGDHWLQAAKNIRQLLNGDGAIAMRDDISTDSKDNGCVEQVFWAAMKAAGFSESDL